MELRLVTVDGVERDIEPTRKSIFETLRSFDPAVHRRLLLRNDLVQATAWPRRHAANALGTACLRVVLDGETRWLGRAAGPLTFDIEGTTMPSTVEVPVVWISGALDQLVRAPALDAAGIESRHMDWSTLEHAYGSAEDLPPLFDKIRDGKAAAVDALANRVAHQGWVSADAAFAVVPTLTELVEVTSGKVRAALLVLLADLACAGSHVHFLGVRFGGADGAARVLGAPAVLKVRAAVIEHAGQTHCYLSDKSAPVRGAAALLMAVTGQDRGPIEARLRKEKHVQARADLLMALGWLGAPGGVFEIARVDGSEVVRAGASIGHAYDAPIIDATLERDLLAALKCGLVAAPASSLDLPSASSCCSRTAARSFRSLWQNWRRSRGTATRRTGTIATNAASTATWRLNALPRCTRSIRRRRFQ